MTKVLIATRNEGKLSEFKDMFQDFEIDWLSLTAVAITEEVEETGTTFFENALLKAQTYAKKSNLITLGDDSGLVVDALNGAPGVKTARYGGPGLTSEERYQLLLENMKGIPTNKRTARFCCAIVVVGEDGRLLIKSEGICEGVIAESPQGQGGFGYDPIFFLPHLGKTMAQLSPEEKHKISHRGKALKKIESSLKNVLDTKL